MCFKSPNATWNQYGRPTNRWATHEIVVRGYRNARSRVHRHAFRGRLPNSCETKKVKIVCIFRHVRSADPPATAVPCIQSINLRIVFFGFINHQYDRVGWASSRSSINTVFAGTAELQSIWFDRAIRMRDDLSGWTTHHLSFSLLEFN